MLGGKYRIMKLLGEGSFARVNAAIEMASGTENASVMFACTIPSQGS
jgi:hypothetical protein